MSSQPKPLSGIRVLDLSRVLAGPFCAQLLADLGADVVKVERPPRGDDTRQWGPPFFPNDGPSAYYVSCNRGKRSLALDLAQPDATRVLDDLLRAADVLIENFMPQSLERLGLTDERIRAINPRLVRASISGYGRTGPEAATPGYDLVVQATAGIMSITGEPDGAPMKIGVAITDVITGLYAAVSVLAGLLDRQSAATRGQAFDLALADCTLAAMVNVVEGVLVTGERPGRYGNAHPQIVPYEAFAAADGHLVLAIGNDSQWQRFCAAVGRQEWAAEPRFATNPQRVANRAELVPLIVELMAGRTIAEWQELLAKAEVPVAPVMPLDAILATPQVAARRMVHTLTTEHDRAYQVIASPIHVAGEPLCSSRAPPAVGEHTVEILKDWLGYNESQLDELRQTGVI